MLLWGYMFFFFIVANKTAHAIQELNSRHAVQIHFLLISSSKSSWVKNPMLARFWFLD